MEREWCWLYNPIGEPHKLVFHCHLPPGGTLGSFHELNHDEIKEFVSAGLIATGKESGIVYGQARHLGIDPGRHSPNMMCIVKNRDLEYFKSSTVWRITGTPRPMEGFEKDLFADLERVSRINLEKSWVLMSDRDVFGGNGKES